MNIPIESQALDALFLQARTHNAWFDKPVDDAQLHRIWDLARMGPTSANCSPMRVVFVKSPEAKARLLPALMEGNRAKVLTAPVTAIFGNDSQFFELLPTNNCPNCSRIPMPVPGSQGRERKGLPPPRPSATARCRPPISCSPPAPSALIAAPCQASTMPWSIRNSFLAAGSSRTSSAVLATAIPRGCFHAAQDLSSKRPAALREGGH